MKVQFWVFSYPQRMGRDATSSNVWGPACLDQNPSAIRDKKRASGFRRRSMAITAGDDVVVVGCLKTRKALLVAALTPIQCRYDVANYSDQAIGEEVKSNINRDLFGFRCVLACISSCASIVGSKPLGQTRRTVGGCQRPRSAGSARGVYSYADKAPSTYPLPQRWALLSSPPSRQVPTRCGEDAGYETWKGEMIAEIGNSRVSTAMTVGATTTADYRRPQRYAADH